VINTLIALRRQIGGAIDLKWVVSTMPIRLTNGTATPRQPSA
jgi:hypothetical protein